MGNIVKVTAYKTTDNSIFETEQAAKQHQLILSTSEFLGAAPGGLWKRDYLKWLMKYKQAIVEWAVAEGVKCTCAGGGPATLDCYHCDDRH